MTEIERRTLAPTEGGRVRKPDGTVLAVAGESVVFDTYWKRRLDHGDVIEVGAIVDGEPAKRIGKAAE